MDNVANAEWEALLSHHGIKPTVTPVDSNDDAARDVSLAHNGMKPAMTNDTRVARQLRMWSLCLFIAAPALGLVGVLWVLIAMAPTGDDIQNESAYIPSQIATNVVGSIVVAMLTASFVLAIIYYAGPWRRRSQQRD